MLLTAPITRTTAATGQTPAAPLVNRKAQLLPRHSCCPCYPGGPRKPPPELPLLRLLVSTLLPLLLPLLPLLLLPLLCGRRPGRDVEPHAHHLGQLPQGRLRHGDTAGRTKR